MGLIDDEAIENLKSLEEATGKDLISALSKLYIETTPQIIAKINEHINSEEYKEASMEAHSLKSSSANLGVNSVRELFQTLEYGLNENRLTIQEIKILLNKLESNFIEVSKELSNYCKV